MGIFDDIVDFFTGNDDEDNNVQSVISQGSSIPGYLEDFSKSNVNLSQALAQTPHVAFPGSQVAGFNQDQQNYFDRTRNFASEDVGQFMSPYTQQVIDTSVDNMNVQLDKNLNRLGAQAVDSGAFGGGRHGVAEAELMAQTGRDVGQLSAGMYADAYGDGRTVQQRDIMGQAAIGGAQQANAQQNIDANIRNFTEERQWPFEMLNVRNSTLGSLPYTPSQTTTTSGPQPNSFAANVGALGGLATGIGALGGDQGLSGVGNAISSGWNSLFGDG